MYYKWFEKHVCVLRILALVIYILHVLSESVEDLKELMTTTRSKWPPNEVLVSAASETSSSEEAPRSSEKPIILKAKKMEVNEMHIFILYVMTNIEDWVLFKNISKKWDEPIIIQEKSRLDN